MIENPQVGQEVFSIEISGDSIWSDNTHYLYIQKGKIRTAEKNQTILDNGLLVNPINLIPVNEGTEIMVSLMEEKYKEIEKLWNEIVGISKKIGRTKES